MKKRLIKISAIVLTAAVVAGAGGVNALAAPMSSDATVDSTIVTASAHRAASPLPDMLGANVPSGFGMVNGAAPDPTDIDNCFALQVWGSVWNQKADPYWVNYYRYLDDATSTTGARLINVNAQGSPVKADTVTISDDYDGVSVSLYTRPDVLIGVDNSNSYTESYSGYASQLATIANMGETYNPVLSRYNPTSLDTMIATVKEAAASIQSTGKATRYTESPATIAEEYEDYVHGVQGYILATYQKKNIAVITAVSGSAAGSYTYTLAGPNSTSATSANRYVEYMSKIANNVCTTETATVASTDTNNIINNAEYIIVPNATVRTALVNDINAGNLTVDDNKIISEAPQTLYGLTMNSVENAIGLAYYAGQVYCANDTSINSKYLMKYFYQEFLHIKPAYLESAYNMAKSSITFFPPTGDQLTNYDFDTIADILNTGEAYYHSLFDEVEEEE